MEPTSVVKEISVDQTEKEIGEDQIETEISEDQTEKEILWDQAHEGKRNHESKSKLVKKQKSESKPVEKVAVKNQNQNPSTWRNQPWKNQN